MNEVISKTEFVSILVPNEGVIDKKVALRFGILDDIAKVLA